MSDQKSPDPQQLQRYEPPAGGELSAASPAVDPGRLLEMVINQGVTGQSIDAVKAIVELYKDVEAMKAEKAYQRAFNALQAEMPSIKAVRPVNDKQGNAKYTFAPYEDIMEQVRPMLIKHGFTLSFSTKYDGDRIIALCTLGHMDGHKQTTEFAARIGQGPPGSSTTQADGAAGTYAKRFALCNALNIIIEKDNDARAEGASITKAQAEELHRRVNETNTDQKTFLSLAKANSFAEIRDVYYPILDELLARKEGRKK